MLHCNVQRGDFLESTSAKKFPISFTLQEYESVGFCLTPIQTELLTSVIYLSMYAWPVDFFFIARIPLYTSNVWHQMKCECLSPNVINVIK